MDSAKCNDTKNNVKWQESSVVHVARVLDSRSRVHVLIEYHLDGIHTRTQLAQYLYSASTIFVLKVSTQCSTEKWNLYVCTRSQVLDTLTKKYPDTNFKYSWPNWHFPFRLVNARKRDIKEKGDYEHDFQSLLSLL